MKIIFLDIDGVLNNMNYTIYIFEMLGRDKAYEIMHNDLDIFDPISLDLLCKLIEHFKDDIKIVLSSTWRLNQKGIDKVKEKIFNNLGYEIPFDVTKRHKDMIRGFEIEEYLIRNKMLSSNYIIIDDDTYDIIGEKYTGNLDFSNHMVECNHDIGFQGKEYLQALKILKGKEE